jgi:hypothetical protein
LPQQAQIAAWIIVENNRDMRLAFVVLLNALDGCNLPAQRNVQDISALARKEPDAIAYPDFDSLNQDVIYWRLVFE